MRCSLVALVLGVTFGCSPSKDDGGGCPPGQQKVGIYCLEPVDGSVQDAGPKPDTGSPPSDAGQDMDAGRPDDGVFLPDAGGPPDVGPTDASIVTPGAAGRILVRGSVVLTMATDTFAPGEVYSNNGTIECVGAVGDCAAQAAGASIVDTQAIVLPGLIDAHNHLAYNWLPEWEPGTLFNDSLQWRNSSASYDMFIEPYSANSGDRVRFCAMVQWGELRSLVNGTTTALGAPQPRTCFRWLVRNPELSTGYNGWTADRMRTNTLGIGQLDAAGAADLIADMDAGMVTAYMIHLAEGISVRAHDEYDDLVMFNLLRPETKIIHGTALTATDLNAVAAAGSPIVWSPSSNMALYGETLDIPSAVAAGVTLALAADWTPSGEDDLLGEVRFARLLTETRWPGTFTDREYVEMVTARAAEAMAIDEFVGTLEVGKHADILVVTGDTANPYDSVIQARPQQIRLVLIGGIPSYGEPAIMQSMIDKPSSCHDFDACGATTTACWEDTPDGPVSPGSIAGVIQGFYPSGPWQLFQCN